MGGARGGGIRGGEPEERGARGGRSEGRGARGGEGEPGEGEPASGEPGSGELGTRELGAGEPGEGSTGWASRAGVPRAQGQCVHGLKIPGEDSGQKDLEKNRSRTRVKTGNWASLDPMRRGHSPTGLDPTQCRSRWTGTTIHQYQPPPGPASQQLNS